MNARFEPPTVKQRSTWVLATEHARHAATKAMAAGAREGKLPCSCCKGATAIRWSGNGLRSSGSCITCREVRWAQQ